MKRLKCILLCFVLILLLPLGVQAFEDELTNSIANDIGDVSYGEYVQPQEKEGVKQISIAAKLMQILVDSFSVAFKSIFKTFVLLSGILITASLLSGLKSDSKVLSNTYDYISILVLSSAIFATTKVVFDACAIALKTISGFLIAYLPAMTTMYALGGNPTAAAANWSTLTIYTTLIEAVASNFLLPFLNVCFALCIVSALPSCIQLGSLSTLIKNSVTTVLAFMFSMLSFVMYFQTTIAAAADNQAMRAVRFASGTFVPVIGSVIGETAKNVFTSISVIKTTAGAAGIIAMLSIIVPPLCLVITAKLSILVAGMLGRLLGLERESKLLYEVNGLFGVLLAIILGAGVVFFIAVAVFMKTNAGMY